MQNMNYFQWVWFLLTKYYNYFIQGLVTTLEVSIIGTTIGFLLGFLLGMIETVEIREDDSTIKKILLLIPKYILKTYVTVFRGTPMIVQAMLIYYGTSQTFGFDLPPFQAAIIIISLNTGAYMSETVRGGINSVDAGQIEGAKALGMTYITTMLSVVFPQTLKNIAPQLGNTFVANIKDTAVLNVICVTELFYVTKAAAGTYYRVFEAYTITALIYLLLTIVINKILSILEKKLAGNDHYEVMNELS